MIKVRNMQSERTGRAIPNQFIIEDGNKTLFQSYESPIVEVDRDAFIITFYPDYNYSNTTRKYRNKFLIEEGLDELSSTKAIDQYIELGKFDCFKIVAIR